MDAVLSGSPGFTLIAIIIALAAYLRGVSAAARDKIESIIAGKESLWLPGKGHTQERLRILNKTRRLIKKMTHFFFGLAVAVGVRLCLTVAMPHLNNIWVYVVDVTIVVALVLAIFGMWSRSGFFSRPESPLNILLKRDH